MLVSILGGIVGLEHVSLMLLSVIYLMELYHILFYILFKIYLLFLTHVWDKSSLNYNIVIVL